MFETVRQRKDVGYNLSPLASSERFGIEYEDGILPDVLPGYGDRDFIRDLETKVEELNAQI
jgi:hypothetical protein